MLTPYLFVVSFSLAAANPILQRIQLPGQSYPVSACSTCPTQTCPTTSKPCQTCQNPYRNAYNPHPLSIQTSNNCPCNKPVTVQNPVANPSQVDLSEYVIRRLLNPQPQVPVNPVVPTKPCSYCEAQKTVPNIINNYIIIPPEYFKTNETIVDKDKEDSLKRRRKGKRRKQTRQQVPACHCDDMSDVINNNKNILGEHATPCQCDNEKIPIIDTKVQNETLKNVPRAKILERERLRQRPTTENKNISQNDKRIPSNRETSSKTTYPQNNQEDTKTVKRRNRERTRALEEAIIRDFCKKHPTIPEEIARSLLKMLKKQVKKNENSYNSPYPFKPYSYSYDPQHDEYVRANGGSVENDRPKKRKPYRSGRRNKKPKEQIIATPEACDKECEVLVETKPTVINIEKEIVTTEKITATTENTFKGNLLMNDSETQMETPNDLLEQLDQMKAKFAKLNEIETTTVNYNKRIEQFPELGKEDKVPTVYDNGVDDYYPDFRGDNVAFYESDEECDSKEDSKRYVSETDIDDKLKSNIYETSSEYPLPVSTESYESYDESITDDDQKIRFRIPPHLELPDFETRQVNKDKNNEFVADDFNAYFQAPRKTEMKPAKVFTKDKSGRTNVETVLGHSKVVKYGQDAEAAASEPMITYYLPEEAMTEERIQLPDGEGVIVVAKSIQDLEDDWEYV